jgi:HAD superfamily phosphoserine phosphatase-like hydrolase
MFFRLFRTTILFDCLWDVDNYRRIIEYAKSNPGVLVVFDADGTLWSQDLEQAFFSWYYANNKFVSPDYNCNSFHEYELRAPAEGLEAYKWLLKGLAGIKESDLIAMASHFVEHYFVKYIYSDQIKLIAELQRLGACVWVVSASNQWLVRIGAQYLGIDPAHVIGIRLKIDGLFITNEILMFPYKQGKVDAINECIGKMPGIVIGDSSGDVPMLQLSDGLSVYINHEMSKSNPVLELAQASSWMVQYFPLTLPMRFSKDRNILEEPFTGPMEESPKVPNLG